jgi:uncharacterized protein (TIGR02246 family)
VEAMANGDGGRAALLTAEDENAIRSVLARLGDAWACSDGEAYAACFAENSDYITFNGMHPRGRAENAELHSVLFRGVLKDSKLLAEIESLELLASGVALVHTTGSGRKTSYQTYVLVKSGADWLIRSFQNTRVQPISAWITRWMQRRAGPRWRFGHHPVMPLWVRFDRRRTITNGRSSFKAERSG